MLVSAAQRQLMRIFTATYNIAIIFYYYQLILKKW